MMDCRTDVLMDFRIDILMAADLEIVRVSDLDFWMDVQMDVQMDIQMAVLISIFLIMKMTKRRGDKHLGLNNNCIIHPNFQEATYGIWNSKPPRASLKSPLLAKEATKTASFFTLEPSC
jgi:hypothetical protein